MSDPPIGGDEPLATAPTGVGGAARGSGDAAARTGEAWPEMGNRIGEQGLGQEQNLGHHASPEAAGQLLDPVEAATFTRRWTDIQAAFVDEPRQAVVQADALVSDVIQRLTRMFADEHTRLEQGLDRDDDASTEDLRVGLQRYRDFFHRLLAT